MTLPKIKNFAAYNHYPSDPQPTTDADMQDYMLNQNDILTALTKRLWQPQTAYKLGDIVASDAMADGLVAVCTIAGVTSDIEPEWGVNEATVIDNSCTWIMRPAYCYGLATEGDVQTVYDGGEAEVSRLLSIGVLDKIFEIFKGRIGELFGDNDVLPIAHGGTGTTTAANARTNLGLATVASTGSYNDLSNKPTIATQSANGLMSASDKKKLDGINGSVSSKAYISATYVSGTSWYRKWSDGWIEQGGYTGGGETNSTVNLITAMTTTNYTIVTSTRRSGLIGQNHPVITSKSTTNFTVSRDSSTGLDWYVCGK